MQSPGGVRTRGSFYKGFWNQPFKPSEDILIYSNNALDNGLGFGVGGWCWCTPAARSVMEIVHVYQRRRKDFGRQCNFSDRSAKVGKRPARNTHTPYLVWSLVVKIDAVCAQETMACLSVQAALLLRLMRHTPATSCSSGACYTRC